MMEPAGHAVHKEAFIGITRNRIKFNLFLLNKLPAAYFSGLTVEHIDAQTCTASVPYRWFTQNPFRSTYFACLSMAAEMSTGILAMAVLYKQQPAVSMLITGLESKFLKKAVSKTAFTCRDGKGIEAAVHKALSSGEAQSFRAYAKGINEAGETIAEFWFTWSFKARSKR